MASSVERVRAVIAESGLSHGDFARAVGLDAPKLSKSLSGVRRFSSLDLARIGDLTGHSVDWLLGGEDPPLAMAARAARGGVTAEATAMAYDLAGIRRGLALQGFPQAWNPPAIPATLGDRDSRQGEELARIALRHLDDQGLSCEGDLAEVIEAGFGADVTVADLSDDVDGLAVITPEANLIIVASTHVPYRQRFTMAHELGHLLAGDNQELHVDEDIFGAGSRTAGSERRANAFAAGFLMPEEILRGAVGGQRLDERSFCLLVMRLRVSPAALAYRLDALGLIDGMASVRYRALSAKQAAALAGATGDLAKHAAEARTARPPGLLLRDAFSAYSAGATTLRPYAHLLGEPNVERLRAELEETDELPRRRTRPSIHDMRSHLGE